LTPGFNRMLNVVLRVFAINTSYHKAPGEPEFPSLVKEGARGWLVLLQEGLEMVEKAISTHLH
jgi:hypothetical protein